jgi:hypothetical protein
LRAPCSECNETQRRLSDVADEVEQLRGALQDAESRRKKEVEDALWLADSAEAKYTQLMTVLRQVLSSNGGIEGLNAATIAADLMAPAASRGAEKSSSSSAPSDPSRARRIPRGSSEHSPRECDRPQSGRTLSPSGWQHSTAGFGRDHEANHTPTERPHSDDDSPELVPTRHRQSPYDSRELQGSGRTPRQESPRRSQSAWWERDRQQAAHSSGRKDAGGARLEERRSSEPAVVYNAKDRVQAASPNSARSNQRGASLDMSPDRPLPESASAPGDLSDATQKLELEVVELCRALGGGSSQRAAR